MAFGPGRAIKDGVLGAAMAFGPGAAYQDGSLGATALGGKWLGYPQPLCMPTMEVQDTTGIRYLGCPKTATTGSRLSLRGLGAAMAFGPGAAYQDGSLGSLGAPMTGPGKAYRDGVLGSLMASGPGSAYRDGVLGETAPAAAAAPAYGVPWGKVVGGVVGVGLTVYFARRLLKKRA